MFKCSAICQSSRKVNDLSDPAPILFCSNSTRKSIFGCVLTDQVARILPWEGIAPPLRQIVLQYTSGIPPKLGYLLVNRQAYSVCVLDALRVQAVF